MWREKLSIVRRCAEGTRPLTLLHADCKSPETEGIQTVRIFGPEIEARKVDTVCYGRSWGGRDHLNI
jgi:hypothetical protein